MGHDPKLKYWVIAMVAAQLISAYLLRDAPWITIVVVSYLWGGVINHSMTLAIHEISHNLAFGNSRPAANRALGIFGNLVMGIPYSVVFRKYHQVCVVQFQSQSNETAVDFLKYWLRRPIKACLSVCLPVCPSIHPSTFQQLTRWSHTEDC